MFPSLSLGQVVGLDCLRAVGHWWAGNLPFQGRVSKPKRTNVPPGCHTKHLLILHMLAWPPCPSCCIGTATERPKRYYLRTRWRQTLPHQPSGYQRGLGRNSTSSGPGIPLSPAKSQLCFETWRGLAEERGQGLGGSENGRYQWKITGAILQSGEGGSHGLPHLHPN